MRHSVPMPSIIQVPFIGRAHPSVQRLQVVLVQHSTAFTFEQAYSTVPVPACAHEAKSNFHSLPPITTKRPEHQQYSTVLYLSLSKQRTVVTSQETVTIKIWLVSPTVPVTCTNKCSIHCTILENYKSHISFSNIQIFLFGPARHLPFVYC